LALSEIDGVLNIMQTTLVTFRSRNSINALDCWKSGWFI